jgi:hypothetical protein
MSKDLKSPVDQPHEKALLEAVNSLTTVVGALQSTLENDYPTRAEVRRRRLQLVVTLVGAIVGSYFFTVGTVSYCFLTGIPDPGTHRFCYIFPGYEESFENNRQLQERFFELEKFLNDNRERIRELEGLQPGETPTQ